MNWYNQIQHHIQNSGDKFMKKHPFTFINDIKYASKIFKSVVDVNNKIFDIFSTKIHQIHQINHINNA